METKVCQACPVRFEVGGRGRPKKSQPYCSRSCAMKCQSPRKRGSSVPRPKKNKDTLHNKAWLEEKYLVEKLSLQEIADLLDCSKPNVRWALKKHRIQARSHSEGRTALFDRRGRKEVTQAELIEAYGGCCECCGEAEQAFLTIDHIGGGGTRHRRSLGGNFIRKLRQELKAQGWPREGFRLLCMNCNFATRHGKTCPHQLKEE